MKGLLVVVSALALLQGCSSSPSKADRDDENKKWSEWLATVKDVYKLNHECDVEYSAYQKGTDAALEALRTYGLSGAAYRALELEKEKAEAHLTACLKRQSDYVEEASDKASFITSRATRKARYERLLKASDAWLDACVKCGKAPDCIARYREATRLKDDQQKDYGPPPVCY